MNKFEEYNSSQIVPQRTLLMKFNKVIEFLKANPVYNLFMSSQNYIDTGTVYSKTNIATTKNIMEVGDLVLFANVYIGVVSMIGEDTFSISRAIYFQGAQGEKGDSGNSFRIIGTVNSTADLPSTAPYGTAYFVGTTPPRDVYCYDSLTNSWVNEGKLQSEISLEEVATSMQGDNDISISYIQDAHIIQFTFNNDNYYTRQQIQELLNGKSMSFVIDELSDITGNIDSNGNFTNVSAITGIDLEDLRIGDIILIKELSVADYWVSKITPTIELNKMEIAKVDLLNGIFPVGSVYMSVVNTNPSILFGGTWEQLKDRFLLGAGDIYSAGATGGEATHTLTISEMPTHSHLESINEGSSSGYYRRIVGDLGANNVTKDTATLTQNAGDGLAHNNMPPYLVLYMWKRIA